MSGSHSTGASPYEFFFFLNEGYGSLPSIYEVISHPQSFRYHMKLIFIYPNSQIFDVGEVSWLAKSIFEIFVNMVL